MTTPIKIHISYFHCPKCGESTILMLKGTDRNNYCPECGHFNNQRFITNSIQLWRVTDLNLIKDIIPKEFFKGV